MQGSAQRSISEANEIDSTWDCPHLTRSFERAQGRLEALEEAAPYCERADDLGLLVFLLDSPACAVGRVCASGFTSGAACPRERS